MKRESFPISNEVIVQLVQEFGLDTLNDARMFPVIHARMIELSGKGEFSHKQRQSSKVMPAEHKGGRDAKKATDIPM
ncbi:hypothetical protein NB569_04660 [Vibrio alginolyticus]|uniref:hypothetical protein n=1 Tax=Vibrio alginolyticus TaxID=663 RepID=UPI00215BD400|nr:hypothetical protein [Vibrio alginolyticus]MCR9921816.1 hypothetical protein [Vibrio alginolyticus]